MRCKFFINSAFHYRSHRPQPRNIYTDHLVMVNYFILFHACSWVKYFPFCFDLASAIAVKTRSSSSSIASSRSFTAFAETGTLSLLARVFNIQLLSLFRVMFILCFVVGILFTVQFLMP